MSEINERKKRIELERRISVLEKENSDLNMIMSIGDAHMQSLRAERDEARRERDAARAQLEQERKALTELQDLCPRMSDDDPIAPAIADCLKRYKAAQS